MEKLRKVQVDIVVETSLSTIDFHHLITKMFDDEKLAFGGEIRDLDVERNMNPDNMNIVNISTCDYEEKR